MNKVSLVGRLTKNIEIRYTASNVAVANFTLAVNRTFKNKDGNYEADFINCIAFKNSAEYLSKYARKGDRVAVSGSIQVRNYDAQDGSKRYVTEIVVESAEFVGAKKDDSTISKMETDEIKVPQNYKSNYEGTNDLSIQLNDDDIDKVFDNSLPF